MVDVQFSPASSVRYVGACLVASYSRVVLVMPAADPGAASPVDDRNVEMKFHVQISFKRFSFDATIIKFLGLSL